MRTSGRSSRANAELQTGKSQRHTATFNIMPSCTRLKWRAASGGRGVKGKKAGATAIYVAYSGVAQQQSWQEGCGRNPGWGEVGNLSVGDVDAKRTAEEMWPH